MGDAHKKKPKKKVIKLVGKVHMVVVCETPKKHKDDIRKKRKRYWEDDDC